MTLHTVVPKGQQDLYHDAGRHSTDLGLKVVLADNRSCAQRSRTGRLARMADFHREALDVAAIVAVTDRSGRITSVNRKFCELSGYDEHELVGSNHRILRSGIHPPAFFADLYRTISQGSIWHGVICNKAKSGSLYWVDTTIVPHSDKSGYTAIRFDVTPQKEAEQRLWRLANIDVLTGLANRRRFMELLEDATRQQRSFASVILDLDNFKDVNDSEGHDAGDRLLQNVAESLKALVDDREVVGRLGGDEFALLLNFDGDVDALLHRLEGLVTAIGIGPAAEVAGWAVQASAGAAIFPQQGSDEHELLKCADMALYAAKQAGRGCARLFEPRLRHAAEQRAGLSTSIQRALIANDLFLLYQPIINLAGDQPPAFEALLRWRGADGSVTTPGTFGAVFDDERASADIGNFVLTEVIHQIDRWRQAGVPFSSISINATLGDFRSSSFVDRIVDAVETGRFRGDQLCIEITEGMLLDRGAHTVRQSIDRLHAHGVGIAFDDFGTGFASLTHLRHLPIDHVKIDRSFIEAICSDRKDRVIVESVIALAHRLGLRVVAEGVEQPEQLDLLRRLGCDSIQGFLVAPALTEHMATDFINGAATNQGFVVNRSTVPARFCG
ncbi:EAL domain-containing protein [Sphingomonas sp. 1P06PA]|uniref:putative bifunctional diguanylate cyclase/phosphodiesterase n=1 Tax=Sphingomonas sp. 1P06PA TaxID=554121 RepID=UPI0039A65765